MYHWNTISYNYGKPGVAPFTCTVTSNHVSILWSVADDTSVWMSGDDPISARKSQHLSPSYTSPYKQFRGCNICCKNWFDRVSPATTMQNRSVVKGTCCWQCCKFLNFCLGFLKFCHCLAGTTPLGRIKYRCKGRCRRKVECDGEGRVWSALSALRPVAVLGSCCSTECISQYSSLANNCLESYDYGAQVKIISSPFQVMLSVKEDCSFPKSEITSAEGTDEVSAGSGFWVERPWRGIISLTCTHVFLRTIILERNIAGECVFRRK